MESHFFLTTFYSYVWKRKMTNQDRSVQYNLLPF